MSDPIREAAQAVRIDVGDRNVPKPALPFYVGFAAGCIVCALMTWLTFGNQVMYNPETNPPGLDWEHKSLNFWASALFNAEWVLGAVILLYHLWKVRRAKQLASRS